MMLRLTRFALVLMLTAATAACGGDGDTPTAPSLGIPYSATDLVVGTGNPATLGRSITVTYTGWLYSTTAAENKGTQFDSNSTGYSYVHGTTVVAGFGQGVNGMRVGGRRRVVIPPELGYGTAGAPPTIPGNATLIFEIALTAAQ
jgi:FKBP-type peptidyl-prolyl cis-trans isomerase FkpA